MSEIDYIKPGLPEEFHELAPEPQNGLQQYFICCVIGGTGSGKSAASAKFINTECREGRIQRVYAIMPGFWKSKVISESLSPFCKRILDEEITRPTVNAFLRNLITECGAERKLWDQMRSTFKEITPNASSTAFKTKMDQWELDFRNNNYIPNFFFDLRHYCQDNGLNRAGTEYLWFSRPPSNLLLMDDCLGTAALDYNNKEFVNMCIMHRHYSLNIMILSQALKQGIPRTLRRPIR